MMPKPKRPRPDLVERLCHAIERLTAERTARSTSYATQWVMLDTVARHLGVSDDEAQQAVALALARGLVLTDGGSPPHSVSLIWGGGEG
jgi:hypothetical protein